MIDPFEDYAYRCNQRIRQEMRSIEKQVALLLRCGFKLEDLTLYQRADGSRKFLGLKRPPE